MNVRDVATYILDKMGAMSAMKLQKLCYYSQAWSLVWDDRPFFDSGIEAWANGPVCPELYDIHRGRFNVSSDLIKGDPSVLDQDARDTINAALETYGGKSAHWLSSLTHQEAPWMNARNGLPAERVVRSLNQIIEWRGKPDAIRVDNGPEYISATLLNWAAKRDITIMHIQPGKPQQNAYIERYNRTVRQEWPGRYIFETINEVQDHATRWLWTYNNERPNMGIGGITPMQKLKMAA